MRFDIYLTVFIFIMMIGMIVEAIIINHRDDIAREVLAECTKYNTQMECEHENEVDDGDYGPDRDADGYLLRDDGQSVFSGADEPDATPTD